MSMLQNRLKYFFLGFCAIALKYPRIRDLREDRDWNQTQIANMLHMSQTGYSKYETGENDISTLVLIALAEIYDVSIDYLLGQTANPYRNI